MRRIRTFVARIQALFVQTRANRELDDELNEHLEMLTDRFVRKGMSPRDAAAAARRQFGNPVLLQQRHREARTFLVLSSLWRDLCFGARMLRKHPGSTAAVIVALALGIGMNSCVFTFVNALLLRPPAEVQSPGQLREIWQHNKNAAGMGRYLPFPYPDYAYFRDHTKSFTGVIAYDGDPEPILWSRSGRGEVVHGQFVSGNAFAVTGVGTILGHTFSQSDDQPSSPRPLTVLAYKFWQKRLGADPNIVGKSILFNGTSFTVVGVAPPHFTGLEVALSPDFWAPLSMSEQMMHDAGRLTSRDSHFLMVEGRLAPGQSTQSAQAEASLLAADLTKAHPESNKDEDAQVYTAAPVPGPYRGYVAAFTGLLMAVFALVLVIACTNAASLLMVKATGRAREMAIRSALGAGRGRLIRQMTIESLLLSLIAACASVALAAWTSQLLLNLIPANLPISLDIPIDWRVLAFTFLVALITGVVFGATPALRGTKIDPVHVLKDEAHSGSNKRSRMRTVLMTAEVAVCTLLLFCAALCVRSLIHASSIDPGFDVNRVAIANLDPGALGYNDQKVDAFYRSYSARVQSLPGVVSSSYVNHLPLDASREETGIEKASESKKEDDLLRVDVFRIASDYFRTMGTPILKGREFTQPEADRKASAVVVNETLARELWPGEDPVGQLIKTHDGKAAFQVIGVVKTGKYRTLGEEPVAVMFRNELPSSRVLVVRTAGDPRPLLDLLPRAAQQVDSNMAATGAQTMRQFMSFPLFSARVTGLLLGASGILGVILTWIGLFGVISFSVSQRTREIGVRMAMGARRKDVLRLVMRQGLFVTAVGLVIGIGAALAAARMLTELLYGISPNDPVTVVGVAAALAVITLLASYLPARRATRVNPTTALRYE